MSDDDNSSVEIVSEDSSDEDDAAEQEMVRQAQDLEDQLSKNKFLYEVHVSLVELYKKISDLDSLRLAFRRFHECFPLTGKIWMSWLQVEISLAQKKEEQDKVFELFEEAVEDYLCVDLWMEFINYSLQVRTLGSTRILIEKALTKAGLHCTKGALLWDTLRELEGAELGSKPPNSEEYKAQALKLYEVFKRQLSISLEGMEETYSELQEWAASLPPDLLDLKPIEWGYNQAVKNLKTYEKFEENLRGSSSEQETLTIFEDYLKAVEDPSTKLCIFERAVSELCLNPNLWLNYLYYSLDLGGEIVQKISKRASRNCTWDEQIWCFRLRILEHSGSSYEEILTEFELAINSILPNPGLDLWLTYLECTKRLNFEQFLKLIEQARKQLRDFDQNHKINRFYARLLAEKGDLGGARKTYNFIVHDPNHRGRANVWLELIQLERQFGGAEHVRSTFQKALKQTSDFPELIAEEWLMFERQFGSLRDVFACEKAILNVKKVEVTITTPTEHKKRRQDSSPTNQNRAAKKTRVNFAPPPIEPQKTFTKNPETTVFLSNLHSTVTEEDLKATFPNAINTELAQDRKGKSRCFGYVTFSIPEEALTAIARDREPLNGRPMFVSACKADKTERKPVFKYATKQEENKLFVRGLPIERNQAGVEAIFAEFNPKAVRLVQKKSGQLKGLAYVEFDSPEAARRALLKTDQLEVDGHVISVAISAPPSKSAPANEIRTTAKPRLQMGGVMVPRAVQAKNGSGEGVSKKSNADFRSLFLK